MRVFETASAAELMSYVPAKHRTPEPNWNTELPLTWDELCGCAPELAFLLSCARSVCPKSDGDHGSDWRWWILIRDTMSRYVGWFTESYWQRDNGRLRSQKAYQLAYDRLLSAFEYCSCEQCRSGTGDPETATTRRRLRAQVTGRLRFQVFERDAYRCRYCGRHLDAFDCVEGEHLVVEHVLAIANGGTSDLSNLVTACNTCNAGKGTRYTQIFTEAAE